VVWADRISPAHAVITSVPLPSSAHRHGDVVLHDGEPVGSRAAAGGGEVPVFDELERLASGPYATTVVTVTAPAETDAAALLTALAVAGAAADDWTSSVRMLCAACADGTVHEHPDGRDGWHEDRTVGMAGIPERTTTVLDRWAAGGAGRAWRRAD
jgi:hypothetical protein